VVAVSFIFASYGLVIVLVNALLLLLLNWLFPEYFAADSLLWALVAGALIGLLGTFLENLLGLVPPIVPDEETGLRRQFWHQPVGSLGGRMVTRRLSEEEQLTIEAPEDEGQPIRPGLETQSSERVAEAETPALAGAPSEGGSSEADVSPDPTEGAPDATGSPRDEQPDTPMKEEGGR
jgi:hypothetical protein